MDIKLLKADILSNKIPNFLIFEDHEYGLCKQYINYIKSTKNLPLCYCSADEAIYNIETNIKNNEQIFIIYNDAEVLNNKDKLDKIANYDKYIIIYFDIEIDEKSYLYKNYNINIVKFDKLDNYTILAYLQKICNNNSIVVDQEKLIKLINYCNNDLSLCLNELEKILIIDQENSNLLMDYMLNDRFSDYRTISIYHLIDRILKQDKTVFNDIYKLTESPVTFFAILYNKAKYKYINTRDTFYIKLMRKSSYLLNSILDGSFSDKYAIQYLLLEVFN